MDHETQGRKEVGEAVLQGVLIAALSAVCTGIINWQIENAKAKAKKRDEDAGKDGSK